MSRLDVQLLGPPQVFIDGVKLPIRRRKVLALLAYLAMSPKPAGRDFLAELLFPWEAPDRARSNFRQVLSLLQSQVGRQHFLVTRNTAELRRSPDCTVDAVTFRGLVRQAQTIRPVEEQRSLLEEAASVYRGQFLESFFLKKSVEFEDWQLSHQQSLQRDYSLCLMTLAYQDLAAGANRSAIARFENILSLDPLDESAYRGTIEALAAVGDLKGALQTYQQCYQMLERELGVEPELETVELAERVLFTKGQTDRTDRSVPAEVPVYATSFVGRNREVKELRNLLISGRDQIVTLVGPPGTGKTRLAVELSRSVGDVFGQRIHFVDLATTGSESQIASTVAAALRIRGQTGKGTTVLSSVCGYLGNAKSLLLLDNYEHLLPGTDTVTRIAAGCPDVTILTTSREPLGVQGERQFLIQPLAVPPANGATTSPERFESVRLFLERAARIRRQPFSEDSELYLVSEICHRLDGLPLAIELTVPRINSFTLTTLYERLHDSFLLSSRGGSDLPDRQRTLQREIQWSYDLLNAPERQLFAALSVFSGGCELAAVEAVCAACEKVDRIPETLDSLVRKNLVVGRSVQRVGRYIMLTIIREYAQTRLSETPHGDVLRDRHAEYYLTWAEERAPELHRDRQISVMNSIDLELGNIRTAIERFASKNRLTEGLRLCVATTWYWYRSGLTLEGITWFDRLLAHRSNSDQSVPHDVLAQVSHAHGWLLMARGDTAGAAEKYRRALLLFRSINDRGGEALTLAHLGVAERWLGSWALGTEYTQSAIAIGRSLGDPSVLTVALIWAYATTDGKRTSDSQEEGLEEALALSRKTGDHWSIAHALHGLGDLARVENRLAEAIDHYQESLNIFQELGDSWLISWTLGGMGRVQLARAEFSESRRLLTDAIDRFLKLGDRSDAVFLLAFLVTAERHLGNHSTAATLTGAFEAYRGRCVDTGAENNSSATSEIRDQSIEYRRDRKSDYYRGFAMSLEEALQLVRTESA